ncbi:SIR2 family protein [Bradyrhizobium sp. Pa8]|uniref:SIR2 family protein n=1 Tax=Bradyrhizobium sp. Pa8 TaxID=3386552 RepID=UPI00403F5BD1
MSLAAKYRTDLPSGIEKIVARLKDGKSFVPLVGAGLSYDAGIPIGQGVVKLLKTQFPDRLPNDHYEYSEAFNAALPGPENRFERRKFFEALCAGYRPGVQTGLFANLIEHGVFRVVLTTNFDHLIEQALVACSSLPIQIFVDEEAFYPTVPLPRCPTILKVHGDFLFDDLANLEMEMQRKLSDDMKTKLIDGTRNSDLIVIGYGGLDERVMKFLEQRVATTTARVYAESRIWWLIFDRKELENPLFERLIQVGDRHNSRVTPIGPASAKRFLECLAQTLNLPVLTSYPFGINPSFKNPLTAYTVRYSRSPQGLPVRQAEPYMAAAANDVVGKLQSRQPIWIAGAPGSGKTQMLFEVSKKFGDRPLFYFSPKFSELPICPHFMTDLRTFAEQIGVNTLAVARSSELYQAIFANDAVLLIDDVVSGHFETDAEWLRALGLLIDAFLKEMAGNLVFTCSLSLRRFMELVPIRVFGVLSEFKIERIGEIERQNRYVSEIASKASQIEDAAGDVVAAMSALRHAAPREVWARLVGTDKFESQFTSLETSGLLEAAGQKIRLRQAAWEALRSRRPPTREYLRTVADTLARGTQESVSLRREHYLLEAERLYFDAGQIARALELISLGAGNAHGTPNVKFYLDTLENYGELLSKESSHLSSLTPLARVEILTKIFGLLVRCCDQRFDYDMFERLLLHGLKESYLHLYLAFRRRIEGQLELAIQELKSGLRVLASAREREIEGALQLALSASYIDRGASEPDERARRSYYTKSLGWAKAAEKTFQTIGDLVSMMRATDNEAGALVSLGRYQQALELLKELQDRKVGEPGFNEDKAVIYGNIYRAKLGLNEIKSSEGYYFESQLQNASMRRWDGIWSNLLWLLCTCQENRGNPDLPTAESVLNHLESVSRFRTAT